MTIPFQKYNIYQLPVESSFLPFGNLESSLVLVLDRNEWNEKNKSFLENILKALSHTIEDILIIVLDGRQSHLFRTWKNERGYHYIVFGLPGPSIGIQAKTEPYTWIKLLDYQFLFVDELEKLQTSIPLKKQLWTALKAKLIDE